MNAYIERILSPGVSISRNVLDDEDEEFHRQRESEIDIENAVSVHLQSEFDTELLIISASEPAVAFTRASFGESLEKHSRLKSVGEVKIHDKPLGIFYHMSAITVFEVASFKSPTDENLGFLSQCAIKVLDAIKPRNVVALDSLLESKFHHRRHTHEEIEPPLSRMIASRRAKESFTNKDLDLIHYLETSNLIRGMSAAFLMESEMRNIWAILVCSLQNVRWFGSTVVAYLPVLEILIAHSLLGLSDLQGQLPDIRSRCLKAQEKADTAMDMIYM